jgi:hypothetical protein
MKAGHKSKALDAASKALEIYTICYGEDAPFTIDLAKSVREIEVLEEKA